MKQTFKLIFVFCIAFCGLLLVWTKSSQAEPVSPNSMIETQSQLYISNCARCHGADGKGNTPLGQEYGIPDLTSSRMRSSKIKRIIQKGDGDMPAFSKKLTSSQISSLIRSVRAFRR